MSKQRIALVCIALHAAVGRINLKPGEVLPDDIDPRALRELERLKAFRVEAAETNSSSKDAGEPTGDPGAAGGANAGTNTSESGSGSEGGGNASPSVTEGDALPSLNTADADALEQLGLSATQATRLVEWRAGLGRPIESVDEITAVNGIGPATVEEIRPRVTV